MFGLFLVLIVSMLAAGMEHVETTFQADIEHVRECYKHFEKSVQASYVWVLRVMSIRRKVAQWRN